MGLPLWKPGPRLTNTHYWIDIGYQALIENQDQTDSATEEAWRMVEESIGQPFDTMRYTGTFMDPWFGKVMVSVENNTLYFRSLRSPKLSGPMFFYTDNTFAIKMNYTDMVCDAFASFEIDEQGNPNPPDLITHQ